MIRNKGIPRDKIPFRRGKKRDAESMNDGSGAEAREARAAGREARSREAEAREAENREAEACEARARAREARAREEEEVTEAQNRESRAREERLREAAARAEACRVEETRGSKALIDDLSEDDCAVANDDDCDGIENDVDEEDEDETNSNQAEDEEDEVDEEEEVDEDNVDGDAARDEADESDADSGDDIWDDERIPDPLSSDDEDDEEEQIRRDHQDPDELLALGKTFNSAEDFKLAVLRYSLKTRYDVKLYRSQATKIGAKCSDTDVPCGWRIYCSYEKRKQKMQVKVYINEHTCVRSGYSKMLKRSSIAWLFAERLRLNPKLTKQEMVSEILREYNLVVSDEQCGKAKTKVLRERKASHEAHFTKRAHAEIEKMIEGTKHCIRHMARDNFHEVEVNNVGYSVDMNNWSCGCRKWEMVGIPCVHAAAVIIGRKEKVGDYVSDYYTTKTWQETYKKGIRPVQGMLLWPRLNRLPVLPPPWRKGDPGRPSNYARKKGRYETATSSSKTRLSRAFRVITCSNCKEEGHNKQRCPNETVPDGPKRPRGRPRKNQDGITLSQVQGSQGLSQVQESQGMSQVQGSQGFSQGHV